MRPTQLRRFAAILGTLAVFAACEEIEQVVDSYRDLTPHEAYLASLEEAGLGSTALAVEWASAARRAVEEPLAVRLPFQEEGFIAHEEAGAVGYRFGLERGQVLTLRLEVESEESANIFLDLFRVPADADDPLRPVVTVDASEGGLVYEPPRTGEYVVRLQPELLRGGRYRLVMTLDAALAFPVDGKDTRAILSFFGQDRDGGSRSHHGVDIFAARGTPVLATSSGTIRRANITGRGGKVVWLTDEKREWRIYYAHLDSQAVERGDRVEIGDTLGFVGNTGNAITTAPHLHFGVYARRATDPIPFIRTPPGRLEELMVDTEPLGEWARVRDDGIRLRAMPGRSGEVVVELDRYTPFRLLGGSADWYRVRLPDGEEGWVAGRLTEKLDGPVMRRVASQGDALLVAPTPDALVVARPVPGTELPVLGSFAGYVLVEDGSGARGWLSDEQD